MEKIIILFFIGLISVSGCSKQQNKYAADMRSVYGKWTAISKACVPGSILNISEGKLEYITEGYTEDFIVVDNNNFYPEPFSSMPKDSVRHILKILNSKYSSPGMTAYISLTAYTEKYPYTGAESVKLVVMDKDFKDDSEYFKARKANSDIFGWGACVYSK